MSAAEVLRSLATDMDLDGECDHLSWVAFGGLCFCGHLLEIADYIEPQHVRAKSVPRPKVDEEKV